MNQTKEDNEKKNDINKFEVHLNKRNILNKIGANLLST